MNTVQHGFLIKKNYGVNIMDIIYFLVEKSMVPYLFLFLPSHSRYDFKRFNSDGNRCFVTFFIGIFWKIRLFLIKPCEFSYSNVREIIPFTSGLYYPSELEFYNRIYLPLFNPL